MVSYARRIGRPLHYEVGPEAICDPRDPNFQFGSIPLLAQWYTDHLENLIRRSPGAILVAPPPLERRAAGRENGKRPSRRREAA